MIDRLVDSDLKRAMAYIVPYWRRLTFVLALSLFSTALSLILPYLSKDLVDQALVGRDAQALIRISLLFLAITLAGFILNILSGLRYTRVSAEILFDMRLALYRHLQRLSPRFYARMKLGDIVSRINNDIGEIQRISSEVALAWVGNVLFLIGTVAMLLWLNAKLFLVSIALLPLSLYALIRYRRELAERVLEMRRSSAEIGSFLIETLQGMKLVVTSNAQEREVLRFRLKNDAFIRSLMSMQLVSYLAGGLPGVLLSGSTALVFLFGGFQVIQGVMTVGTFVAFMAYQMRLLAPIQALMGLYAAIAAARVSLTRLYEILDTPPDVVEAPRPVELSMVRGEIDFTDVSLSHNRGGPVLDRISIKIPPGEVLAVVGPSGSGKSSLADLTLRLLDPDSGTIRLDGHDLRQIRLEDLRKHVIMVDQEPFLLHTTIAENLRYAAPGASDAEMTEAARAAGIADFIERLPDRYETIVGERGMTLSAGERQRLGIARAFLCNPSVLLLDEATAALDPVSERQVVSGYQALMRGRTTILISHRYHLACIADRVVVLDGARIVEEGSPLDLRGRKSAFAALFAREESLLR